MSFDKIVDVLNKFVAFLMGLLKNLGVLDDKTAELVDQYVKDGETILKPNCIYMNTQMDHLIEFAKRELNKQCQAI